MAIRYIMNEIQKFNENEHPYISLQAVDPTNLFRLVGSVMGPENSPYYGGVFFFEIQFPKDFPFHPLKIYLQTRIYHPNINWETGYVCVEPLTDRGWSPVIKLTAAVEMVRIIMEDPDPDNPIFNSKQIEIAKICKEDRRRFNDIAREMTEKYAMINTQEWAY